MQIDEHQQAAVTVVTPRGALTGDEAGVLLSRLRVVVRQCAGRCVLDLTHVPYLDSQGLEAIVDISEEMSRVARSLKIAAANETLREVLDVTEVAAMCDQYDDVGAAVRSFS
ncbi:MAG: STAS domain-containing protein [Phycisphaerales bacterium]